MSPEASPHRTRSPGQADDGQDVTPDGAESAEDAAEPSSAWLTEGISALEPENAGPGAAAFFDIDNTIMRGSSIVALAKGMADRDYFTTSEVVDFTWKQLKYVLSGRENMDDMAQATENGLLFVKGREPREIEDMAEQAYDERMVGRLWAGTVELAEAHKALGHEVWLVSATPVEVADVIARRLGLTGGLGTIAEVADGHYTGKLDGVPLHGAAKVEVIAATGRRARPRPDPVRGLLRLVQRHPDALVGRLPGGDQPGRSPAVPREGAAGGRSATTGSAARSRSARACRQPRPRDWSPGPPWAWPRRSRSPRTSRPERWPTLAPKSGVRRPCGPATSSRPGLSGRCRGAGRAAGTGCAGSSRAPGR